MALDMANIAQEIYQAAKRLQQSGDALFQMAKEFAEAEQEYRKALAAAILSLKDDGMSISLINDLARGCTADLKFKRDLAETRFTAAREKVKSLQSEISALQSIYRRQDEM